MAAEAEAAREARAKVGELVKWFLILILYSGDCSRGRAESQ